MSRFALGCVLLLSSTAGADASLRPIAESPAWHTDYTEVVSLARQSGKPIFLVFR